MALDRASDPAPSPPPTAVLGAVAAGAALQRRHLRTIARDADYRRLRAPLDGRPLRITSPDGTELYAEAFGPDDAHDGGPRARLDRAADLLGPGDQAPARGTGCASVAYDLRGHGRSHRGGRRRLLAGALRRGPGGGAGRGRRRRGPRAGHGGRPLAGRDVDRRLGRAPRSPRRGRSAAALLNTGLGDLVSGHLLLPQVARFLNHPRASRAVLGSKAPGAAVLHRRCSRR